ncbi:MAG: DUF937 domain-containing protein [Methylocystis sp.]|uniref:DUF937 domain-containing protein n=1 Tax=Methylocystis sp. TaxID=1911079 RepID=UPI003D11F645
MSYLDEILQSAQGGQLIANLAQSFGLTEEQIGRAIDALAPAIEVGLSNAAEEPQLLEKLLSDVASPQRAAAFDDPGAAQDIDAMAQSRQLLDDLYGSPAGAGQVLQVAARESGLRPDILSQLLPVLISVLLGGLFKKMNNSGLGGVLGQLINSGALGSILEQMLGGGRAPPQRQPMPPQREPMPTPQGGGLIGGILSSILGSLLGGGGRPAPGPYGGPADDPLGGGYSRGGPIDTGGRPQGLPDTMDQASIEQAIEEVKKTLQVGRGGSGQSAGARSDFESILGQMFGKR